MSICITCNLPEGVIIGVDSAATAKSQLGGVQTVYNNAIKLHSFSDKPIGVAFYGMATIGQEPVGLILREVELKKEVNKKEYVLEDIVELIRKTFFEKYTNLVQKEIDAFKLKNPETNIEIPINGIVIGGYSSNCGYSEVWDIQIPFNKEPNSARKLRTQGNYGENWFAVFEPIQRYYLGYDIKLYKELIKYFSEIKQVQINQEDQNNIDKILRKYEYPVPFQAMPILEGVKHVSFLIDFVIQHFSYVGAPIVGGTKRIGIVDYKKNSFKILENDFLKNL